MGKNRGLYKRGSIYWLRTDPITGQRISTGCKSLKAAEDFLADRERTAKNPAYAAASKARLGEWCGRFVEMKTRAGVAEQTIGYYHEKLGHWIRVFGEDAPLSTFERHEVFDAFFAGRSAEGASRHTVSKEVKVFRQVLASAKRAGYFGASLEDLRPEGLTTSYTPRDRAMTVEEFMRLLPELRGHVKVFAALAIGLGLRKSEVLKLHPGDFDEARGIVVVRGTKTKRANRVVPVISVFRQMVFAAAAELPLPSPLENLWRDLRAACRRAAVTPVSANDLRRSNATILAELGADERHLSKMFGHANEEMMRRVYARPRAEALGALVERDVSVHAPAFSGAESGSPRRENAEENPKAPSLDTPQPGFLSRRSHVRIVSGAPLPRASSTPLSQACSKVESLALVALGSVAARLEVGAGDLLLIALSVWLLSGRRRAKRPASR